MSHTADTGARKSRDEDPASPSVLAPVLNLLAEALYRGQFGALPDDVVQHPDDMRDLEKLLAYIRDLQALLSGLVKGEFTASTHVRGFTGGLIKALQSNLRHLVWKSNALADGSLSQRIDFMGEVSVAFNTMAQNLELATQSLLEQQRSLEALHSELRHEIEARKVVEQDLRLEQEKLHTIATVDMLTGIANRRYFFQLAYREVDRMRRMGMPAALAMLDIDHFKSINDTYGHKQGDTELRLLAQVLGATVRAYDIPARYGGDEFVVFFPDTEAETACKIMERLRGAVVREQRKRGTGAMPITISAGVTSIVLAEGDADTLDIAIGKADAALYASKRLGRNRVTAG